MQEILIYIVILFLFIIILAVGLSPIVFIIWLFYRSQKKGGGGWGGGSCGWGGGSCGSDGGSDGGAEVAGVAGAEIEDMRISKWPQKKEKKSTSNS